MTRKRTRSHTKGFGLSRRDFTRRIALAGAGLPAAWAALSGAPGHPAQEGQGSATGGIPITAAGGPDHTGASRPGRMAEIGGIHLFSKHLQFLGYEEMAGVCADAGVDGVDLTVRPGGHVLPQHVEKDLPRAARAIRDAGLELAMMTTRITDPHDPLTERILRTASDLGVKYYRMGYYRYVDGAGIPANLEVFRDKMGRLAELNRKYGIHGAYQNHSGRNFGAPVWDLWEVIREMDPEWTGCQYDIRHAVVEGSHSWPLALQLLKDHVRCMVVKDFHWEQEEGSWRIKNVPIGDGMVDFNTYFDQVQVLGIGGPVSLHIEYPLFPEREMPPGQKKSMALKTIRKDAESLRKLLPATA